jgi:tRNA/tmRNA/rRNA uracil-C5-methylase (TrmA/RlmC/RlmD family)
VQLTLERESNRVQLVLVWNAGQFKEAGAALPRLIKRLRQKPELWQGISVNFNSLPGNSIFNYAPRSWKVLWGPPALREHIGAAKFFFRPQAFRQANLEAFESNIVPLVCDAVPEGASVAELYSGVGVLGLNAAASARATEVLCSDSSEYVEEVFDKSADSLQNPDARESVFFEAATAADAVMQGQCELASVLIVDPPRKGLDEEVLQLILGTHEFESAPMLQRLVYVSCGFRAFERDARALLESGLWQISEATGVVLFPGSDHMETVAVFDRTEKEMPERVDNEERDNAFVAAALLGANAAELA